MCENFSTEWTSVKSKEIKWCCDHMSFMIDNGVAEPNIMSMLGKAPANDGQNIDVCIGYLSGVRITRAFFLLSRNSMHYECPFCRADLIRILDFFTDKPYAGTVFLRNQIDPGPAINSASFKVPMSVLEKALKETKERSARNSEVRQKNSQTS